MAIQFDTMLLTIIFGVILVSHISANFLDTTCVTVRGKTHKTKVLANGINRPYQISLYKPEHEMYFSFNVGDDRKDTFAIGYIKKNMTGHEVINEIENGFATAVDEAHHTVYFGGSDGVYMKELKGTHSNLTKIVDNVNVWDMFFKHHLYIVTYPSQKLYKYIGKGNKIEHESYIHEKILQFAIDGDDDIFITNATGLYLIKNHTTQRHLLHGEKDFRAIAVNNKGEAYFAGKNAIYVALKHKNSLRKVAHTPNIFGLTFDAEDNIIFSDPHQILKLIPGECKDVFFVPVPIPT